MTKDARELLRKAMSMPPKDRAQVAQELLRSLEQDLDQDVDAAWQKEAARRLQELDKGQVRGVTWESVRDRLSSIKVDHRPIGPRPSLLCVRGSKSRRAGSRRRQPPERGD